MDCPLEEAMHIWGSDNYTKNAIKNGKLLVKLLPVLWMNNVLFFMNAINLHTNGQMQHFSKVMHLIRKDKMSGNTIGTGRLGKNLWDMWDRVKSMAVICIYDGDWKVYLHMFCDLQFRVFDILQYFNTET